jgi:nucleoside-diphosphate-sugar epimerase
MPSPLDILVTGGTGYIGRNLIPLLLARGHRVRVLAREESVKHVPAGATAVTGDALSDDSVAGALRPGDTLIHLVGTPHPTPSKADQFEKVDLVSIRASVSAARETGPPRLCQRRSASADHASLSLGARARQVDDSTQRVKSGVS